MKVPNFENKYYNDLNQIVGDIYSVLVLHIRYNRAEEHEEVSIRVKSS